MRRDHLSTLLLMGMLLLLIGGFKVSKGWAQGTNAGLENGGIRRSVHPQTGKLTFLGIDPRTPLAVPAAKNPGLTSEDRGIAILNAYGREFGLQNANREMQAVSTREIGGSQASVRYQQVFEGIPVVGGELVVHMTSQGGLISIGGEISPDLDVSTTPQITAAAAQKEALQVVSKVQGIAIGELEASEPELWVYDARLLEPSTRPAELVWRLEVRASNGAPVNELVLVNAEGGWVSLHFNQIDTGWEMKGDDAPAPAGVEPLEIEEAANSAPQTSAPRENGVVTPVIYFDMVVDDARGLIYGSDRDGGTIHVISQSTLEIVQVVSVGSYPSGIDMSPDGSELAVALFGEGMIRFLDLLDYSVIADIVPSGGTSAPTPTDLIYGRSGRIYSVGHYPGKIYIFDTVSKTEIYNSLETVTGSPRLAMSRDKNTLFVTRVEGSPQAITSFDVSSDTVVRTGQASYVQTRVDTIALNLNETKVFSSRGQIWSSGLSTMLGTFPFVSDEIEYVDSLDVFFVESGNEIMGFSGSDHSQVFAKAFGGTTGVMKKNSTETILYVSTSNGIEMVDLINPDPFLKIIKGNNQAGDPNQAFDLPLGVQVVALNDPVPGVTVIFSAPISGPSGTFADSSTNATTVVSDSNGMAIAPTFTANSLEGNYVVGVSAVGMVHTNEFNLENKLHSSVLYFDMVVDDSRGLMYASDPEGGRIYLISQTTLEIIDALEVGGYPIGIDISPDASELAVAQKVGGKIIFIDLTSYTVIANIYPDVNLSWGRNMPYDVIYGRPGRLYSVGVQNRDDRIHVIDTVTKTEIIKSVNVETNSPRLAISSDNNSLYVSQFDNYGGSVSKFDISTDIPNQVVNKPSSYGMTTKTVVLNADETKLITSKGQVWLSDLSVLIGNFPSDSDEIEYVPNLDVFFVNNGNELVGYSGGGYSPVFAKTFGAASGVMHTNDAGSMLFVATGDGMEMIDLLNPDPYKAIIKGNNQAAYLSKPFVLNLGVQIVDLAGPVPGVPVTFTAPSDGPSGTFEDSGTNITTVVTDTDGIAIAPVFTANGEIGNYVLDVSAPGVVDGKQFNLRNQDYSSVLYNDMVVDDTRGLLYAADHDGGRIYIISQTTLEIIDALELGLSPTGIDMSPDASELAVALPGARKISFIDLSNLTITGSLYTGAKKSPMDVVYGRAGRLYTIVIDSQWDEYILVIDTVTITEAGRTQGLRLSLTDANLTISPDKNSLFLSDVSRQTIRKYDVTSDVPTPINSATGLGVKVNRLAFNADVSKVFSSRGQIWSGDLSTQLGSFSSDSKYIEYVSNLDMFFVENGSEILGFSGDDYSELFSFRFILYVSTGIMKANSSETKLFVATKDGMKVLPLVDPYMTLLISPDHAASIKQTFPNNFKVQVRENLIDPMPGVEVTFTAPASGPSGVFEDSGTNTTVVVTDVDGFAIAPAFTANDESGNYSVVISAAGISETISLNMYNLLGIRLTFTMNNISGENYLPGNNLCFYIDDPCTNGLDAHADAAHQFAGDSYYFYAIHHQRDSFDDAGMAIVSSVHYGVDYFNAFWNGFQLVYGDGAGFPLADDVVGHEYTHGVTQYTSNLFNYYQSGAISESLSDVWGEFIDLTNGDGDDSPGVRWLIGEDISGLGALRSMADPTTFGDPDRMTSSLYHLGDLDARSFDNGGVHFNSGVNNKAVYLMTDGGVFNGFSVAGLGIDKIAAIYYEVQYMLTSGSDYLDLYNNVYQACLNLIGGAEGITPENCNEVLKALDAVEMDQQPQAGFMPEAATCGEGYAPNDLFFDDFESGVGNWSIQTISGPYGWGVTSDYAADGFYSLYGINASTPSEIIAVMANPVTIPASGNVYLHFEHAFGFESSSGQNWDGGVIEVNISGLSGWYDVSYFTGLGQLYNGNVSTQDAGNQVLAGRNAFVKDSHGYVATRYQINNAITKGRNLLVRFRIGTDGEVGDMGWVVDNFRIYTCDAATPTPSATPPNTSTPTDTPTPTDTLTPTITPTPSDTPPVTDTPTASPTSAGGSLVDHIVDDQDAGFTPVGPWATYTKAQAHYDFYLNAGRAKQGGNGSATGTFTPDLPEAGDYEVFAWLDRRADGATNLPFTIHHSGGPTLVTVNLRTQPPTNGGWVSLGNYTFPAGASGQVVVSDDAAGGWVIADAVRWYKPGTPTDTPTPTDTTAAPVSVTLDNASLPGSAVAGAWAQYTNAQAGGYQFYGGNGLLKPAGSGSATVTFQPSLPKTASYEVFVWVDRTAYGATNMRVEVHHAGGTAHVYVNFTSAPSTGGWVSLGTYTFNAGSGGSVVVTDQAGGGYVIADAVRWVEVP